MCYVQHQGTCQSPRSKDIVGISLNFASLTSEAFLYEAWSDFVVFGGKMLTM